MSAVAPSSAAGPRPGWRPRQHQVSDARWRPALQVGLSVWVASRLAFLVVGLAVTKTFASARGKDDGLPALVWPFRLYYNFDSGHFLRVLRYGYYPPPGHDIQLVSTPFLPGYPFASRWLGDAVGLGRPSAADQFFALAAVAWAGAAVSAVLLWRLAADLHDGATATRAVLILLFGPYSLFLMASYSEGPFLALALGAWLAARNERWWLAGSLAAGAALVRVNAVFLAAALVVMYVMSRRGRDRLQPHAAALLLAPLASFGYLAWLHSRTGSWTTWFLAQRVGWKRETVAPWHSLYNSVHRAVLDDNPAVRYQAWMELVFAAGLVAVVAVLAQRRQWPEFTYVGLTAASLLTSTYYLSVPRTMLVCFPAVIMLARLATRRILWRFVGLAGLVLLLINTTTFLTDNWTG